MTPDIKLEIEVSDAKSGQDLSQALLRYYAGSTIMADRIVATNGPKLACAKGCNYCCYIPVDASAPEIFALAHYINSQFANDAKEALIHRLRGYSSRIEKISRKEHLTTNIKCPLLVDSKCSAYGARPFACRAHHSCDIAPCKKAHEDPSDLQTRSPQSPVHMKVWEDVTDTALVVFHENGYRISVHSHAPALLYALTHPNSFDDFQMKRLALPNAKRA